MKWIVLCLGLACLTLSVYHGYGLIKAGADVHRVIGCAMGSLAAGFSIMSFIAINLIKKEGL